MPRESNFPDWLHWLLRHPLLTIFVSVAALLGIPAMLAISLNYRIASLEERRATIRAGDQAPSEAVPTELPRNIVAGQTVYVPLYALVFKGDGRRLELARTLSNPKYRCKTCSDHLRRLLLRHERQTRSQLSRASPSSEPARLHRLPGAASGGSGANFSVEWIADEPVLVPTIEAVLVGRIGTGVTSFVRAGQVIDEYRTIDDVVAPDGA